MLGLCLAVSADAGRSLKTVLAGASAFACAWLACRMIRAVFAAWTSGPGAARLLFSPWQAPRALFFLFCLFFLAGFLRGSFAAGRWEAALSSLSDGADISAAGRVTGIGQSGSWTVLTLSDARIWHTGGTDASGPDAFSREDAAFLPGFKEDLLSGGLSFGALEIYSKTDPGCRIGNTVRIMGELSVPERARNPGEFDYRSYCRSRKILAQVFADAVTVTDGRADFLMEGLRQLRLWASGRLQLICGEDAGVFEAVLLGDKSGLDDGVQDLYQKNGIAHLLAVSGLHLSLISMAVYGLLRKAGIGFFPSALLGGGALTLYAFMSGASSSVMRALLMALCAYLAAWSGRTYDLLCAVSFAALVLFWDNPLLPAASGVQLSFSAILGIGAAAPLFSGGRRSSGPDAGLGIQLVTLPPVLHSFFQIPLYSIFLNLLVVPLLGIVLSAGAAGIFLSCFSLPAGAFAAGGGRAVLAFYALCCGFFEKLPASAVILGEPSALRTAAYYGCLTGVLLAMAGPDGSETLRQPRGDGAETQPEGQGDEPADARPQMVFGAVRALGVLSALIILLVCPARGLSVSFLDVGQGDGIVLRTGEASILIDGGSSDESSLGEDTLVPFLKREGIRTLDCAIVSHADQDHTSGLLWLLSGQNEIRVKRLVLPAVARGADAYGALADAAAAAGAQVYWMSEGQQFAAGELTLTCLGPPGREGSMADAGDKNGHSLVLRADYGEVSVLFTGDMSAEGEAALLERCGLLSSIDVLKVAHHGSKYSSSAAFLEAVDPAYAVVSYGNGNFYGHPAAETLERLSNQGVTVFETGTGGMVRLSTDGSRIRWETWLNPDEAAHSR